MKPLAPLLTALLLAALCRAQTTNLNSIRLSTPVVTNEQDLVALGALAASGTAWRAEWQVVGNTIAQPDTNAWVTVSNAVATLWRVERAAAGGVLEVLATGGDGYDGPPQGSVFSNRVDAPEHSAWVCGTEWQVWFDTDEGVPIWKVVHLADDGHQWRFEGGTLPGWLDAYTGHGWLTLHWAMGTNGYPLARMADLPDLTPYYPRSNPNHFATEEKANEICYALLEEVHLAAEDPHGDRAYAQAEIAATALLPNTTSGTDPLGTVVERGQVTAVGGGRPWEHVTTNEIAYGFYAIGSPATSLVVRVNEAQTLTQILARCEIGAATATIYSVSIWSNAWSTATAIADVLVATTPTQIDVSAALPANGGWAIAFTNGSAAVTNGTIQLRTVNL